MRADENVQIMNQFVYETATDVLCSPEFSIVEKSTVLGSGQPSSGKRSKQNQFRVFKRAYKGSNLAKKRSQKR